MVGLYTTGVRYNPEKHIMEEKLCLFRMTSIYMTNCFITLLSDLSSTILFNGGLIYRGVRYNPEKHIMEEKLCLFRMTSIYMTNYFITLLFDLSSNDIIQWWAYIQVCALQSEKKTYNGRKIVFIQNNKYLHDKLLYNIVV